MALLDNTTVNGVTTQTLPASQLNHLVRFGELLVLLQQFQMIGSGIPVETVEELDSFVLDLVEALLQSSESISFVVNSGVPSITPNLNLAPNSALQITGQGVSVALGSGVDEAAAGNHSHSGLPILPVTVNNGGSISFGAFNGRQVPANFQGGTVLQLMSAEVIAVPQGGIVVTTSGVQADFGANQWQVARGADVAALIADIAQLQTNSVTVIDSNSIDLLLSGNQISATLNLEPGGGLQSTPSGVGLIWGPTNGGEGPDGTVAPGNHSHILLHQPLTTSNSQSIVFSLDEPDQVLSAGVICDPAPPTGFGIIAVGVDGISAVLGTTSETAAAGDHSHTIVTTGAAGFMSPDQLNQLNSVTALQGAALTMAINKVDQVVAWYRESALPSGLYVGGRHRWQNTMEIMGVNIVAQAPMFDQELTFELGGVLHASIQIVIPSGVPNTEVFNDVTLGGLFMVASGLPNGVWTPYARWVCTSGVGSIDEMASEITVSMNLRPAINFSGVGLIS